MDQYVSAMYQNDVMQELARQADVLFYGPGFPNYDANDSIFDIIQKNQSKPDWIIVGHAWLRDSPGHDIDPHPNMQLDKCTISKAVILNKEYVNLHEKLEWIKRQKFSIAFSHHHDTDHYSEKTGIKFIFWPFGFDNKLFNSDKNQYKDIDLGFSGVLQNQNEMANQTDSRIRVMNRLFFCFGDIPFAQKRKYEDLNIFWNSIPRYGWQSKIAKLIGKYRHLSDVEYSSIQRRTKIFLNTLSPAGLISPRFFENMASRTLIFCEESNLYDLIFPNKCYVTFKSDLSDFDAKLFQYLEDDKARNEITEKAYEEAMENHTWNKRVSQMMFVLNNVTDGDC